MQGICYAKSVWFVVVARAIISMLVGQCQSQKCVQVAVISPVQIELQDLAVGVSSEAGAVDMQLLLASSIATVKQLVLSR